MKPADLQPAGAVAPGAAPHAATGRRRSTVVLADAMP
jgi:hypothetical protein